MNFSWTLFKYLTWRISIGVTGVILGLTALILMIDVVDLLQTVGKRASITLPQVILMAILRTPKLIEVLLPFAFLFGSMWAFYQFNRRSELAAMRAAGVSAWRIVGAGLLVAVVFGVCAIVALNPLASTFMRQAERMEAEATGIQANIISLESSGVSLRLPEPNGAATVYASRVNAESGVFENVIALRESQSGAFIERIDAVQGRFADGSLSLNNARVTRTNAQTHEVGLVRISTPLTFNELQNSAAPPQTMSVWELPRFIKLAGEAGFPVARYRLHWHDRLSTPLKLAAMVLIAAAFSMRPLRGGGAGRLALYAIIAGFVLYVFSDLSGALGESGLAPAALAAWTPTIAALLLAGTLLLHVEDG